MCKRTNACMNLTQKLRPKEPSIWHQALSRLEHCRRGVSRGLGRSPGGLPKGHRASPWAPRASPPHFCLADGCQPSRPSIGWNFPSNPLFRGRVQDFLRGIRVPHLPLEAGVGWNMERIPSSTGRYSTSATEVPHKEPGTNIRYPETTQVPRLLPQQRNAP